MTDKEKIAALEKELATKERIEQDHLTQLRSVQDKCANVLRELAAKTNEVAGLHRVLASEKARADRAESAMRGSELSINRGLVERAEKAESLLSEERAAHSACHDAYDKAEAGRIKAVEQLKSSESRREAAEKNAHDARRIGSETLDKVVRERDSLARRVGELERGVRGIIRLVEEL